MLVLVIVFFVWWVVRVDTHSCHERILFQQACFTKAFSNIPACNIERKSNSEMLAEEFMAFLAYIRGMQDSRRESTCVLGESSYSEVVLGSSYKPVSIQYGIGQLFK